MVSRATLKIKVLRAKNLRNDKSMGYLAKKSDAYVAVHVGSEVRKTQYKDNTLDPEYNEEFIFHPTQEFFETGFLMVKVYDFDLFKSDDAIGECAVRFRSLPPGYAVLQLKSTRLTPRGDPVPGGIIPPPPYNPNAPGGLEVCTGEVHIHITIEKRGSTPAPSKSRQQLTPRSASMLRLPSMPQALAKANQNLKKPWSNRFRGLFCGGLLAIGGWLLYSHVFEEEYVVKNGDWLTKIAKKKKKSIEALCTQNHIPNPDLMFPGQRVKLR